MLDRLERSDRPVEDHSRLRVLDGLLEGTIGDADELCGKSHRDVVEHLSPDRRLIPHRTDRLGGLFVEDEARELAGGVERWHDLGTRATRGGRSGPPPRRARPRSPSPRCDRRPRSASSQSAPIRLPAAGAGAHGGERVSVPLLVQRNGPSLCARRQPRQEVVGPERRPRRGSPSPTTRRRDRAAARGPSARARCTSRADRLLRRAPASRSNRGRPTAPRARA